jgi:hypothetical protein
MYKNLAISLSFFCGIMAIENLKKHMILAL